MRLVHNATNGRRSIYAGLIGFLVLLSSVLCIADSSQTAKITIEGSVRTAAGDPIAEALVTLRQAAETKVAEIRTDAQGSFAFTISQPGTFVLAAEKSGFRKSEPQSISARKSTNHIDLVLTPVQSDSATMEFDDKPNFSIAGVTDWSGAGGHGSETGLRTSEALTKQTLALNSNSATAAESLPTRRESDAVLRDEREQIQKALAHNNEADLHRKLGDIDERLNDPVGAEHEYEEAVGMDPSEANYFSWGTELLLHRAADAAVQVFEEGVAAHSKSARMHAGLASALYANGSIEQAIASACRASDLEPNRSEFYALMAEMEKTANSAPSCIAQDLKRFLNLQPESASANYYCAMMLWKEQRASSRPQELTEIEKLLKKAVTLDPHFGEAYLQLGMIREQNGEMQEALKNYQACILVSPALSECHYRLGLAYRRLGEEVKAKEEIGKYQQAQAAETAEIERRRNSLRQFLVVLKNQPSVH
jgi:tetratricopeptide (TPR) repeat protein